MTHTHTHPTMSCFLPPRARCATGKLSDKSGEKKTEKRIWCVYVVGTPTLAFHETSVDVSELIMIYAAGFIWQECNCARCQVFACWQKWSEVTGTVFVFKDGWRAVREIKRKTHSWHDGYSEEECWECIWIVVIQWNLSVRMTSWGSNFVVFRQQNGRVSV